MKITNKDQTKLSDNIQEAIRELDRVDNIMTRLIEAYTNNNKVVKEQLQNLVQNIKDLSNEEIKEQIDSISQKSVVMRENGAPYITSGDICSEYGIQRMFDSVTSTDKD